MALLEPDVAVLDETDSGLDIDALRDVAAGIQEVRNDRPAARHPARSRTTSASSTTSSPTSCTCSSTAAIVADRWPRARRHGRGATASTRSASRWRDHDRPRRRHAQARLPDLRARGQRQAARLPRLRVVVAEAARRARRDGRLLPALLRQHPPRRVHDRRGGDRRVRGRARARSRASSTRARAEEIVFTRNATEAINLVAYTWARANLRAGDVDRAVAHGAPRQRRAVAHARRRARHRAALDPAHRRLPPRPHRTSTSCSTAPSCSRSARCRTCSARSTRSARSPTPRTPHGALVLVDACQFVPHVATDVQAWDADFVAFSAHKLLGPSGIGALWARHELLEAMPPFLGGGEMIRDVRLDGFTTERRAVEVRSRHPGDRRGDRLRRRRRLPLRARHGRGARPRDAR